MRLAVFADIHANLSALSACFEHFASRRSSDARIAILGDYIDYGPRPNETIEFIQGMKPDYVLQGNHESAMLRDESPHFSTERGLAASRYTRTQLNTQSMAFIEEFVKTSLVVEDESGRRLLLVHGDLSDERWGSMPRQEMENERYQAFDFVISGHTHVPHLHESYFSYPRPKTRNTRKTVFLNPGSVGQPRNHCRHAQYLTLDTATEEYGFHKVPYDIDHEQGLFPVEIDPFYRDRLSAGI